MIYNKKDIETLERRKRITYINAISGIRPANVIGTISDKGKSNLAIFNSVTHLGSDPALIGFILRPVGTVARHTYENILENGHYTINHVHASFVENAHYTSAKLDRDISEFEACGLREEYQPDFRAPFVNESLLKIGMVFKEAVEIKRNQTLLIIGEIVNMTISEAAFTQDGDLNLEAIRSVGVSGLNTYYELKKINRFPYARPNELPNFQAPK